MKTEYREWKCDRCGSTERVRLQQNGDAPMPPLWGHLRLAMPLALAGGLGNIYWDLCQTCTIRIRDVAREARPPEEDDL